MLHFRVSLSVILTTVFIVCTAGMALANNATPFLDTDPVAGLVIERESILSSNSRLAGAPAAAADALLSGADYLVQMQADITDDNAGNGTNGIDESPDDPDDGGWDWSVGSPPAPFFHTTGASPTNLYGATALGLYYAYLQNGDAAYFTALTDAANAMVANSSVWSAADMVFLILYNDLPAVTGTTYSDAAKTKFDARITTYGSATGLAQYIRDARAGNYPNGIIAWDIGQFVRAAAMLDVLYPGDPNNYALAADNMAEVLWQDSYNSNLGYFDVVADAGWDPTYSDVNFYWYNLGITGLIDAFDAAQIHTSEIPGLVATLLAGQFESGAISFCYGANTDDEDWQSTGFAAMTLGRLDQATYQTQINAMGFWLSQTQDVSGGWLYSSGNHYPEVGAECIRGLNYSTGTLALVVVDDDWANQADVDLYNVANSINLVWGYNAFAIIQQGIDAVIAGGNVLVLNGTYVESLDITKDLTLDGESEAGVIIDTSPFSDYGVHSTTDNVSFSNFTIIGPTPVTFGYGLKIAGDNTIVYIENVTVQNSGRSGIDINGANFGDLQNITSTNNGGVGLALTDCSNVTINGITTSGNAWAGIGIYTLGTYYTGGSDNVVLLGSNSFGEPVGLYTEEEGGYFITNLSIPIADFPFTSSNLLATNVVGYYPDVATAISVAIGSGYPGTAFINDRATGDFVVSVGITIQTAINAAIDGDNIVVLTGLYPEFLSVNKNDLSITGEGSLLVTIDAGGFSGSNSSGIYVSANGVNLSGFTLVGEPSTALPRYGLKLGTVTNSVIDDVVVKEFYRTGIDMLGSDGVLLTDVSAIDNGGNGIQTADGRNITFNNITTSGNAWGGIGIFTYGRYSPLGIFGVEFTGSNNLGETSTPNGSIYLEEGNYNSPSTPEPISFSANSGDGADVTLQYSDVTHMLTGNSDNDNNYIRFFASLSDGLTASENSPGHIVDGMYMQDLSDLSIYLVYDIVGDLMSIQAAIDAAGSGETVSVQPGLFTEQLFISGKDLNLYGAGVGTTTLEAVALVDRVTYSVTQWSGTARTIDACIGVFEAGTVSISGLTLDGKELGPNNFYGIHYFDADGIVSNCQITNITYAASPSSSRIVSLAATHSVSGSTNIEFTNIDIPNFQKGGILIMGPAAECTLNNNIVAGGGLTTLAQNGIQVSYGSFGSLNDNIVTGVEYPGADWAGTGILCFESGDVSISGGSVTGCEMGINHSQWNWVYTPSGIPVITVDGVALADNQWAVGTHLGDDGANLDFVILNCDITNSVYSGIDLYGSDVDPWGGSYFGGWINGTLTASINDNVITGSDVGISESVVLATGNTVDAQARHNSFAASISYGVYNDFATHFDARENWWGHISGPNLVTAKSSFVSINRVMAIPSIPSDILLPETMEVEISRGVATGFGVNVSTLVDYDPWCNEDFSDCTLGTPIEVWVDDDYTELGANGGHNWGYDAFDNFYDAHFVIADGGIIHIEQGIYVEQVHITKPGLSIMGAGIDQAIIQSPVTLSEYYTAGPYDNYPVFYIDNVNSTVISGLTVDGDNQGDANYRFCGFGIWNSDADLTDIKVVNIMNSTFSGAQHGVGVNADNDTGGPYQITMENVLVDNFQKNAMALRGVGLTVDLNNVTTIGEGPTSVTAQNGIQISSGANGTVTNCTISDVAYTGPDWTATGFLVFGPGTVNATGVNIDGCQTSVYYIDGSGQFDGGSITNTLGDAFWAYSSSAVRSGDMETLHKKPSPMDEVSVDNSSRAPMDIIVSNTTVIGVDAVDSWGVNAYAVGNINFTVTNCNISNWDYGVVSYDAGGGIQSTIENNFVSYTLRTGILLMGSTAVVNNNELHDCNYVDIDGNNDWMTAAIDIQPGMTSCTIDGNTIYDGTNGIQTWADNVTITNNFIYDMGLSYESVAYLDCPGPNCRTFNNSAIIIGSYFGGTETDYDPTGIVISHNSMRNCYWGVFYSPDLTNGVMAENNYWGTYDGPDDNIGTQEASVSVCYDVTPMSNKVAEYYPISGLGATVSQNVDYCPWDLNPWNCCEYRGDIDHSGPGSSGSAVNIADLTKLVDYFFRGGPPPYCLAEADINGDGAVNITDLTYFVDYLFRGGPEPLPCN